jgi:hypothetical protein
MMTPKRGWEFWFNNYGEVGVNLAKNLMNVSTKDIAPT